MRKIALTPCQVVAPRRAILRTLRSSVVQVIQPGYIIGERVLRPAMVGVSKGGAKAAPPERSAEETQSN